MEGGASISGSHVTIRVNADPVPLEEPPQVDTNETEKHDIREQMRQIASEIKEFLDGYPLSVPEAMALSGLTDISAVFKWRREWDEKLAARYYVEIYPKLSELHEYARVRGFFDPELEECYSSHMFVADGKPRLIVTARDLPALLRKVAELGTEA